MVLIGNDLEPGLSSLVSVLGSYCPKKSGVST